MGTNKNNTNKHLFIDTSSIFMKSVAPFLQPATRGRPRRSGITFGLLWMFPDDKDLEQTKPLFTSQAGLYQSNWLTVFGSVCVCLCVMTCVGSLNWMETIDVKCCENEVKSIDLTDSAGSTASESSSPTSLSVSERASTIKNEPNMAPSPYAGQTVTSATQVSDVLRSTRWIKRHQWGVLRWNPEWF